MRASYLLRGLPLGATGAQAPWGSPECTQCTPELLQGQEVGHLSINSHPSLFGGPSWDPLLLGTSSPKPLADLTFPGSTIGQERQEATGLLGLSEPAWWEAEGFGGGEQCLPGRTRLSGRGARGGRWQRRESLWRLAQLPQVVASSEWWLFCRPGPRLYPVVSNSPEEPRALVTRSSQVRSWARLVFLSPGPPLSTGPFSVSAPQYCAHSAFFPRLGLTYQPPRFSS